MTTAKTLKSHLPLNSVCKNFVMFCQFGLQRKIFGILIFCTVLSLKINTNSFLMRQGIARIIQPLHRMFEIEPFLMHKLLENTLRKHRKKQNDTKSLPDERVVVAVKSVQKDSKFTELAHFSGWKCYSSRHFSEFSHSFYLYFFSELSRTKKTCCPL